MRVLVLTTSAEWTAGVRLLAALAAALSERGDVVAVVCARDRVVERAIAQRWSRLSLRAVVGGGRVRQFAQLRGLVSSLRPDAVLVGSAADAQLAAWAMGKRGGVVRRVTIDERPAPVPRPWGISRTVVDMWGEEELAIGWPSPRPILPDGFVVALPPSADRAPELLVHTSDRHDDTVAAALRAAAALRTRHPMLRLTLAGDPSTSQETRVHAASLGLTTALEVIDVEAFLTFARPSATVLWSAAPGDAGAVGVLAAMQQQVPVVVAADAPFAGLVSPAITGFHWHADNASLVVAEVARVMGDAAAHHTMGEAAAVRAARDYAWHSFVETAAMRLARAAGRRAVVRSP